jgi:hypothetical protein
MKCPKGMIERVGYTRKNKKGSKKKYSRVEAACVPDKGQPGKGPQILPPLDKEISLASYGYSTVKSKQSREIALKKASKDIGTLPVLKRTNLIRNYSKWNPKSYDVLSKDVEFLKKQYSREKERKMSRAKSRSKSRSRKSKKSK